MAKNLTFLSILLLVILSLIALPLIKIPISSSSRGVIRSMGENTQINSVVSGKVVQNTLKKNNQNIKEGDTLVVVIADQLDTQKALQSNQSVDYRAQLYDLNKLTSGQVSGLQTGQYQKELSAMVERISQVQTELSLARKDLDRANLLYNQGVIPKAEYDKFYYDHQGFVKQIDGIREQQLAQWQTQKRETQRQLRTFSSEIQRIDQEQKNYIITAPISGRLTNFSGIQKGNFLIQGQVIGEISPEESLIIECLVLPKDIGFINIGQDVKFQIDTYNYNQWGLLNGKVQEIDQNIKVNEQTGEAYFRVLCKMNNNYLQLKSGYKGNIKKGMTLTARFHLIDRTLWQLLFDRVDDWVNPKLK